MGGIVGQVGQDIEKAGKAVAGEFTHLKAPAAAVPPAPDFDWALVEQGIAKDEVAQMQAKREDEAQRRALLKAQTENETSLSGERKETGETAKIKRQFLEQYQKALADLEALDWSQPNAKAQADTIRERLKYANEGYTGKVASEKLTYPTGPFAQIMVDAGIPPGTPMQAITPEMMPALESALQRSRTSTTHTTGVNDWGDVVDTTKTTSKGGEVPPAPKNLGGEHKTSAAPGAVSPKKSKAELLYDEWFKTGVPPTGQAAMNHVREWIAQNGKRDPAIVTPADRRALSGVDNLADSLTELEPYNYVLGNPTTRGLIVKILNQAISAKGPTGLISGVESLGGIGVDQAFLNQLKGNPAAWKFLDRFLRARANIGALRGFQGNMRMTGPQLDNMIAELPDPKSTTSPEQAADKMEQLRKTIAIIRNRMGSGNPDAGGDGSGKGGGADTTSPPSGKKANKFGVVYE